MAKEVLDTIMSIQPKDSSGGTGETRESFVYKISDDMLTKLPPDYNPHEVGTTVTHTHAHSHSHAYTHTHTHIHSHTHTHR